MTKLKSRDENEVRLVSILSKWVDISGGVEQESSRPDQTLVLKISCVLIIYQHHPFSA
jgi:hypothetical protein